MTVKEFEGRRCVVTGAGKGLGLAVSAMLAAGGASVVICDRDQQTLDLGLAELRERGANAEGFVCDVSDPTSIENFAKEVKAGGPVDVLVNNAGFYSGRAINDISLQDWDDTFNVNLRSVFLMMRAFMDVMSERQYGRIVNVASVDAYIQKPTNSHYAAAKAGVVSLTRSFARELAPSGVLVNGVSPGAIATETAKSQGWLAKRVTELPVGYPAEPDDIAHLIIFLASEKNRFLAGELIVANGGLFSV
jgi:NAD(P)-dependent dehydrogenase (short-subunit alcohol dehydrogenase family)